ncbi:MAG: glycogen debranching enzyme N-terminal domain-containing protein [Chloroflexi bacterium]|nr:glycogen debranching enzyme N-terminal domain-containing protein [Chloroflexota bacterium]
MLDFGRDVCGDLSTAARKEWLVTNGLGGFASGTVGGVLTRRYHGLLIAAINPPLGRTLLVAKLDEAASYGGNDYPLFANRWAGDVVNPEGHRNLERFHLEGTTPVWTFALADALLEKRIWMEQGANTTYIQYRLRRAGGPLTLAAKVLVNYRDYHGATQGGDWQMLITSVPHGLRVIAYDGATPFYLLSDRAGVAQSHDWYKNFSLSAEKSRGFDGLEDHLCIGEFRATLQPGETLTFVASVEARPSLDSAAAYARRRDYEQALLPNDSDLAENLSLGTEPTIAAISSLPPRPLAPPQLYLAADQFIVSRATPDDQNGKTIIAGYPWFGDWGRDTMISLPGLALSTGRFKIARSILRTFARFVSQGMLPNRFPDAGETPEYNTVDATLWYFEAIRAYYETTDDDELLRELFPILKDIVNWHVRGTRYQIHVDATDGLLYAGEAGVQLTWMDAKVGDWVVTPRIGKPVEINALWHNALRALAGFARRLNEPDTYTAMADRVQASFGKFWFEIGGYCYDVIDGPDGNNASLRPNQLFAVSLPHSPLSAKQQKAVVDTCARTLLTSHGLRSLAPDHSSLEPLIHHLNDHGLGSVSEIFDGDPPFTPRGCFAQAWGVAELLRAWQEVS